MLLPAGRPAVFDRALATMVAIYSSGVDPHGVPCTGDGLPAVVVWLDVIKRVYTVGAFAGPPRPAHAGPSLLAVSVGFEAATRLEPLGLGEQPAVGRPQGDRLDGEIKPAKLPELGELVAGRVVVDELAAGAERAPGRGSSGRRRRGC